MSYKEHIYKLLEPIDNNDFRLQIILRFIRKVIGWG